MAAATAGPCRTTRNTSRKREQVEQSRNGGEHEGEEDDVITDMEVFGKFSVLY